MKAMPGKIFRTKRSRQNGGGLLEVLIALVILAFGMLGMANLQAASLRFQKTAHFRGIANAALHDMSERLRANVPGVRAGNYLTLSNDTYVEIFSQAAPVCVLPELCTSSEIAVFDLYRWRRELARSLPGGWGDISGDIENGFVLRVYFKEPGLEKSSPNADADVNCRKSANAGSSVRCFSMLVLP